TPFVQNQAYVLTVAVTVQQRPLLCNCLLDPGVDRKLVIGVFGSKFGRAIATSGVVVHGKALGLSSPQSVHKAARPTEIVSGGTAGNKKWLGPSKFAAVHREVAIESRVFFGLHISAASPTLVAHAPVTNMKRLRGP